MTNIDQPASDRLLRKLINTRNGEKDNKGNVLIEPNPKAYENFSAMLKKLHPDLVKISVFITHNDWELNDQLMVPLPEGIESVKDLPTDFTENQKLLTEQKDKIYDKWIKELEDGTYGATQANETTTESENLSMAELARRKKAEQSEPVSQIIEKKEEEEEDEEEDDAEAENRAIEERADREEKSITQSTSHNFQTPMKTPVAKAQASIGASAELLKALDNYFSCFDSPKEDKPEHDHDRLDRIEAKLDKLIDFRREFEAKLPFIEKLEGMFK